MDSIYTKRIIYVSLFILICLGFIFYGFFLVFEKLNDGESSDSSIVSTTADIQSIIANKITLAQLAEFDGINNENCYIAVDGIVYDVTNSDYWENGKHTPAADVLCGIDGTIGIKNSPHGSDVLSNVPIVGVVLEEVQQTETITLTLEELAKFDGLNGNKCYSVVDGIVYDFTSSTTFSDGKHAGRTMCGIDATDFMNGAPHGDDLFEGFPIIGELSLI